MAAFLGAPPVPLSLAIVRQCCWGRTKEPQVVTEEGPVHDEQAERGAVFRDLHSAEGIFVMPNAWSAGSARMLAAAGFRAIGTTSAGIAYSLGLPDYEGALTREAALEETYRIAHAVKSARECRRRERIWTRA